MSWAEALDAMDGATFDSFGEPGTLTPPEGAAVSVRAIVDRRTEVQGQLGRIIDPTPSVSLLRSEVGEYPRGVLVVDAETWTLNGPVEGEDDEHVIRMWLLEGAA
ncbi:hypothetical protein [Algiphilus sp.]|uniref:head-tail joining protein n=1 Tax=Algiphilus sp. TaxID=1872431 RepID=UPI0025BA565B|nr:hypothetical protein [Algiphilus sp.]MCK5770934.1 hypothetical protein [Algiphilus sp.]